MKKSIVKFPPEVSEILRVASDATAGAVFKAILNYIESGEQPEDLAPDAMCIFKFAILFIRLPKQKVDEVPVELPVIKGDIPEDYPDLVPLIKNYLPIAKSRKDLEKILKRIPPQQVAQIFHEYKYILCRRRNISDFDKNHHAWLSNLVYGDPNFRKALSEIKDEKAKNEYADILDKRREAKRLLKEQQERSAG